ncbi:pilus assembly protein [Mesorhizobium sp. SP-1A]|uniref:TadE/TadG family type IV pilus assembly protein n=1 Tax=Mesorhizobium sp. SP-1A TaxID=3077840 RepID=UPI0028F7087F|nr:pilus assembly protein [Mesorhizobium sp. SP-1A]
MIRRLVDSTNGTTAIEFALILPAILMLVFGTFETGRAFYTYHSLQAVADELARYLFISYGEQDINRAQLLRDTETWLRIHYRYGDPAQIKVSGSVGKQDNIKYREIVLRQPITLTIPMIDVSFNIEASRQLPY